MKKSTKKLIISTLLDEIRRLGNALKCSSETHPSDHPHILKLERKIKSLHEAIMEIESI